MECNGPSKAYFDAMPVWMGTSYLDDSYFSIPIKSPHSEVVSPFRLDDLWNVKYHACGMFVVPFTRGYFA